MISAVFQTLIYKPIYNGLIFFIDLLPWADLGLDIIFFTLVIRFLLLPLSMSAIRTQQKTRLIQPQLKEIKKEYKDDRQTQVEKMMELYRENDIRPFSGFLIILIQFPIIIGLYYVFLRGGLPVIDPEILYSFTPVPETVNTMFLGLINVTEKSVILALIAAVIQYFQTKLALPPTEKKKTKGGGPESFQQEFARIFSLQMKYVFPVVIFFIAYQFTAAIALYLATGGVFHILQEIYVKRRIRDRVNKEHHDDATDTTGGNTASD